MHPDNNAQEAQTGSQARHPGLADQILPGDVDFVELAARTKKDYDGCFDYLSAIDDVPLVRFNPPLVAQIRDKAHSKRGRRFANYVKAVLSILFNWGIERGYIRSNPTKSVKNIKRPKDMPRANRPWTDHECSKVIETAPWHLKVPIALGAYCGLREGDALKISKNAFDGSWIEFRVGKTGKVVRMETPAALKSILLNAPQTDATTLATNSRGLPWTESGFRASWRKFRIALEQNGHIGKHLTFHGLRHTVGTRLAENGFDDGTIAAVLGQKTTAMAAHYSRDADKSKKISAAVASISEFENRERTEFVKPFSKSVKPSKQ